MRSIRSIKILWHFHDPLLEGIESAAWAEWFIRFPEPYEFYLTASIRELGQDDFPMPTSQQLDKPDLIITSSYIEESARQAIAYGCPLIYYAREPKTFNRTDLAFLQQRVDAVVTPFGQLKLKLIDLGVQPQKITVVPPVVVPGIQKTSPSLSQSFFKNRKTKSKIYWGHHLNRTACVEVIPSLLTFLQEQDSHLYIPYRSQLPIFFKQQLNKLSGSQTRKHIHLIKTSGFNLGDYNDVLNAMDIVLSFRRSLEMPITLLQAQQLGIPQIALDSPLYKPYADATTRLIAYPQHLNESNARDWAIAINTVIQDLLESPPVHLNTKPEYTLSHNHADWVGILSQALANFEDE